jgi:hypothetical protein
MFKADHQKAQTPGHYSVPEPVHNLVLGASDETAAQQPCLRRPYVRGVKMEAEDSPPPPATGAANGTASSASSGGGNEGRGVAKGAKHSSKPNLGAILAGVQHLHH